MADGVQVVLVLALGCMVGELFGIFMALMSIKDILADWFRRNGR